MMYRPGFIVFTKLHLFTDHKFIDIVNEEMCIAGSTVSRTMLPASRIPFSSEIITFEKFNVYIYFGNWSKNHSSIQGNSLVGRVGRAGSLASQASQAGNITIATHRPCRPDRPSWPKKFSGYI